MNKVFILTPESEKFAQRVQAHQLPQLEILASDAVPENLAGIKGCNIVLGQPALVAQILPQMPQIKWVQSTFAGIDALCQPGLRKDYHLTGVKEVFSSYMSEYVFLYILVFERNFLESLENQRKATWLDLPYRGLQGLTLGVCGFGAIGKRIAQTAAHFRMRVFGYNSNGTPSPYAEQVYRESTLEAFLAPLDYLVITLPSTPHTRHLINYARLQQMRSSAVLINVGRGEVVAEQDLIHALKEKMIRGAILDVFEEEPLPAKSPLWKMPNVFITPHNAAFSFPEDITKIFVDNYLRFLKQETLQYVIDLKRGY